MNQTYNSIINGMKVRKMYEYGRYSGMFFMSHMNYHRCYDYNADSRIYEYDNIVGEEKLWEGILTLPIMEVGDSIYINEIDEHVTITKRIRTTENLFIYSTSHIIERIIDDKTEKSKEIAERAYREHKERMEVEVEEMIEKESQSWFKKLFKRSK